MRLRKLEQHIAESSVRRIRRRPLWIPEPASLPLGFPPPRYARCASSRSATRPARWAKRLTKPSVVAFSSYDGSSERIAFEDNEPAEPPTAFGIMSTSREQQMVENGKKHR